MRKYLLMGAALSFAIVGPALADGNGHGHGHHQKPTIDAMIAYAAASNSAWTGYNDAHSRDQTASAYTSESFNGSKGLSSQAQNAGANSTLQNALSLAYVNNPSTSKTIGIGAAVAGAGNDAGVFGNTNGTHDYVTQEAGISGSYSGSTGVMQANQNVGANSTLQNATAVATVNPVTGTSGTLGVALASSGNTGSVTGNGAWNDNTNSSGSVDSSFNGSTGVFSLNQNAGANSLMQNAASVGEVTLKPTSASTLAASVATTSNDGSVFCNTADANRGNNGVGMSNSFNGSQGVFQASQNAGANSLIQNSVSVGAVN